MHHRRRGFTLVELLVVVGIIAVLISILLPAMGGARSSANRVKCLSNQRQLAQALYSYATDNKGRYPPLLRAPNSVTGGMNASLTWYAWYIEAEQGWATNPTYRMTDHGWLGLGLLFRKGYIKDPQAFYCPEQRNPSYMYPDGWNDTRKRIGYLYRFFDQAAPPNISVAETVKTMNMCLGRFRGRIALSADIFYSWPHFPKPYGVNVCWSDGSASFVELTRYDFEVSARANYAAAPGGLDLYTYFFWRALETGNFQGFSAKVDALNWTALRAQYPPL